jgi:hypothetical protein
MKQLLADGAAQLLVFGDYLFKIRVICTPNHAPHFAVLLVKDEVQQHLQVNTNTVVHYKQ